MADATTSVAEDEQFLSTDLMNDFKEALEQKNVFQINEIISKENVLKADEDGNTFLHLVAKSGTVEIARQLLKLGSSVHIRNNSHETPVFYALKHSAEMLNTLIDDKIIVDPDMLQHALFYRTEEICGLMVRNKTPVSVGTRRKIQKGRDIDDSKNTENFIRVLLHDMKYSVKEKDNYPLLIFFAAKIGKKNILELILNDCRKYLSRKNKRTETATDPAEELNVQSSSGDTALHYAVLQQHIDAVRFLLNQGANPNIQTTGKLTPLHYAARIQNQEICELLLTSGANVNPNESFDNNPLHLVCGHPMGKVFPDYDQFVFDEFYSSKGRTFYNKEIMKCLLTHGANPDTIGSSGLPLLLQTCKAKRLKEIKILLEFGANILVTDHRGSTALHYAVDASHFRTIDFLLEKGFEIDVRNEGGYTPLMSLLQKKGEVSPRIVKYMLNLGSSINAKANSGATVFHMAVNYCKSDIVLTLLELEADRILKLNVNPTDQHPMDYFYCTALGDAPKLLPYGNCKQVLISYIAAKGNNISDYSLCCLNLQDMEEGNLIFKKSKLELEELKSRKVLKDVDSSYSYYDFLTRDIVTSMRIVQNSTMMLELSNMDNYQDFPCCRALLEHRFKRIKALNPYFNKIVKFFLTCGNIRLTIVVVELILSYFSWRDFEIFGNIISELKN